MAALKLKIKKGASVQVIAGADKGKKGSVLEINADNLTARVQGIRIQTHYDKKDGLVKKEGFIHYSNLKMLEAAAKKAPTKGKAKSSSGKKATT